MPPRCTGHILTHVCGRSCPLCPFLYQHFNDSTTRDVPIIVELSLALGAQKVELMGSAPGFLKLGMRGGARVAIFTAVPASLTTC